MRSASKYIHEGGNTCVSETGRHGGARRCRIRNWNVARERVVHRGLHPKRRRAGGMSGRGGGRKKMWPACEISVPRYNVDIYRGVGEQRGDGGARRRLVYILVSSLRVRVRAIDAMRRYRGAGARVLLRTFSAVEEGKDTAKGEQRTTRGGGKDGRGRWCEDRTIVCLLTAISSQ